MNKILRSLMGLMILTALLFSASPAVAAHYGYASGNGDFYADDTGSVTPGGRAHFTFVVKQKEKGAVGQIEFRYPLDNVKIKSTIYNYATFSVGQVIIVGECIKNDTSSCTFQVIARSGEADGGADYFELTVYDDSGPSVYRAFLAYGKIVVSAP